MFHSKFVKITGLIIAIFILSGAGIYVFNHQTFKEQDVQVLRDNVTEGSNVQREPVKDEIINPVQRYYKNNLEQEEIKFMRAAKISRNNDKEFNDLQMKFIKAADVLNEKYTKDIDPDDDYYKNNWVKLPCVEGIYFYAVNSEYLLDKYGQYLSNAYGEWLKFIIEKESVMQDGGLIVPPDKLREYIIFLEKFVDRNSEFILIDDAKDILKSYLMTYLEGIDNSPIFDKWNTRKMKPEFKASYEKFLSENKDSKYYMMVEELYNKAKANDFAWDRAFDQWLYQYHEKYFKD